MSLKTLSQKLQSLTVKPAPRPTPPAITYTRIRKSGWIIGYRWLNAGTDERPLLELALQAHLKKPGSERNTAVARDLDDVERFLTSLEIPDPAIDKLIAASGADTGFTASIETRPPVISEAEAADMSDEELRRHAALLDRWRFIGNSYQRRESDGSLSVRLSDKTLPLYCGPKSECCMYYAEGTMRERHPELWPVYQAHLLRICTEDGAEDASYPSSRQRTEAYILTMQGR